MQIHLDNHPLVLVVDDDARSAGLLARMLRSDGYEAEVTTDGAAAIARLTHSPVPEALVTDFHLPHADGLAVGRYARSRRSAMPIIMVTGYPQSLQDALAPLDHPPIVLLTKPLDYPELLRRLATAIGEPASHTLTEDTMNAARQPEHPEGSPRTKPHGSFLDDDIADGHEHGERMDGVPREDELAGTSGSHAPRRDTRGEEPFGEVAPSADTEGGID